MLAHLSEPLRISTLLTTNFDTLMEEAYRSLSLPLTVLPVSAKGELPNQRTAGSCDSLIKLHGESHDTRADLSLDDEPSAEDKATFLAYMQRGTGHLLPRKPVNPLPDRTSRLLVVGYSGSDHRCVQMIKHWLEHSTDQPRAYWICFSESDQKRIEELFASSSFDGQIKTVLTARPDLLLYELYQKLQFCLPPGGLTYEFTHILPPERIRNFDHRPDQVSEILHKASKTQESYTLVAKHNKRLLRDAIVQDVCNEMLYSVNNKEFGQKESHFINKAPWYPLYKLGDDIKKLPDDPDVQSKARELKKNSYAHHPTMIDCAGGVVRASALAANKLAQEHSRKVFWIELQDYLDTDSLLRDFLRSLALRCGYFQSMHVTMHPFSDGFKFDFKEEKTKPSFPTSQQSNANDKKIKDLAQHIRLVLDEYRIDPSSVVIFLSGRDSYGVAAGVINTSWENAELHNLHMLIDVFARVGIPTVYMPCTKERRDRRIEQIRSHRSKDHQEPTVTWPDDPVATIILASSGTNKDAFRLTKDVSVFQDIINSTLSEFYCITKRKGVYEYELKPKVDLKKLEFIYSLTLFRHSRHANALASEGAFSCPYKYQYYGIDNDFVRSIQVNRWIEKLSDERLFFMKPGGAFWMHRDIRQAIQSILQTTDFEAYRAENDIRMNKTFIESRARKHFWIGEWYQKAFCSSGHITPVIESVYHLLNSAVYAHKAEPKELPNVKLSSATRKGSSDAYRSMMIESAIMQASKCLLSSWEYLEMWQSSIAPVGWLDATHGKLVDKVLKEAVKNCDFTHGEDKKLFKAIDHLLDVHKSLGEAVVNEGGRSARVLSLGASRGILVQKNAGYPAKIKDLEFKQGVDEIRMPRIIEEKVDVEDEEEKDKDYDRIIVEKLRSNLRSEKERELFKSMQDAAFDENKMGQFSEKKAKWKLKASPYDQHRFIWFLGEAAYLLLRRAKLYYHATGVVDKSNWVLSTVCCNLGIDLCKHLPPWELDYEISVKSKMHRIYSIGLANLGRFYEANRHLCEAQGLVSKWSHGTSVEHAMISIRRAEVKLTECHWIASLLKISIDPVSKNIFNTQDTISFEKENVILVRSKEGKDGQSRDTRFLIPSTAEGAKRCWGLAELDVLKQKLKKPNSQEPELQIMPPRIFEALRVHRPIDYTFGTKQQDLQVQNTWLSNFQKTLKNMYLSILDEAVRALDIAEINLSGKSQSSLWWSRIRTLRLRTYGMLNVLPEDARYCIIFRKQSAVTGIFKNFLAAKRIAGEDELRQLRALKYFLDAYRWYVSYRKTDEHLDYSGFLPESYQAAGELAASLWTNNIGKPDDDLLKLAIKNCINSNPEIKPYVPGFTK
jgi:hypothetical protein